MCRHRSDDELAREATRRCAHINLSLRQSTELEGFEYARRRMFKIVPILAPGWDWIETTEAGDASPTVSLINFRGEN